MFSKLFIQRPFKNFTSNFNLNLRPAALPLCKAVLVAERKPAQEESARCWPFAPIWSSSNSCGKSSFQRQTVAHHVRQIRNLPFSNPSHRILESYNSVDNSGILIGGTLDLSASAGHPSLMPVSKRTSLWPHQVHPDVASQDGASGQTSLVDLVSNRKQPVNEAA